MLGVSIWFLRAFTVFAAGADSSTNAVSFAKDVAPILAQKCVTCHGAEKAKGKYRSDSYDALLKPGQSSEVPIVPGEPQRSHLFRLLNARDPDDRMPQKDDPLSPAQIAVIERWIREGARFDGADSKQSLASLVAAGTRPDPPAVYARPVPVLALAFSPDGRELAAGGYHEITVWDASDGRLLRRIKNVAQQTFALAFSPDGALLAAASGTPGRLGEVKLFDPTNDTLFKSLATAGDAMLAVAFSPDGKRLAASGADNAIRLFEISTGRPERVIEQHADWVLGLAFSPDGQRLASASRDKTARVFDTKSGELDETYTGHAGAVFSVAFSADGQRVLSSSRDREIHVWDIKDAKKISEVGGFAGDVLKLCANSNQVFSVCADRRVRQHSLSGKKSELLRTLSGHSDVIYGLALHEPSGRLATSSYDGEVRVWNTADGKLLTNFIAAPGNRSVGSQIREFLPDSTR